MLSARLLQTLTSEFTTDLQSVADLSLLENRNKTAQMVSYSTASRGLQTHPTVLLEQKRASHFHHTVFKCYSLPYVLIQGIRTWINLAFIVNSEVGTASAKHDPAPLHSACGAPAVHWHLPRLPYFHTPCTHVTTRVLCYAPFASKYQCHTITRKMHTSPVSKRADARDFTIPTKLTCSGRKHTPNDRDHFARGPAYFVLTSFSSGGDILV